MLRDLLSNRTILAGLVFFVVIVGGSLLYSWHVQRTTEAKLERSAQFLQGREKKNETSRETSATQPVENESPDFLSTPDENDENADTPMSDETEALPNETDIVDITDTFLPDDFVSEEAPVEDMFKTTPAGFPFKPYWDYPAERQEGWSYDHKLVVHVLAKLWRQGTRNFTGGSIGDNGRVHPHYTNTLYVEWGRARHPDGTMRDVITDTFGGARIWQRSGDPFELPPPSVRLIDLNSTEGQGIDPYTFLTSGERP